MKRYPATHRRIKLSHIWQPIMLKVRVENVEDEEHCNFVLLKGPTKKFYISCCLTIWLFLPGLAFFRHGLTFFSKGVWQPCGCQHSYPQRQKLLYDISVELQSLYESNTSYVRHFEVIYTRQQNAIQQPG